MSVSPSNIVHLDLRGRRQPSTMAAPPAVASSDRPDPGDDLQSLEDLTNAVAMLKGPLVQAITNYRQACLAVGVPDPQKQLSTLLWPVETLEAGMHRLATTMAANLPR